MADHCFGGCSSSADAAIDISHLCNTLFLIQDHVIFLLGSRCVWNSCVTSQGMAAFETSISLEVC